MIDDDTKRIIDDDLERFNLLYKFLSKPDVMDDEEKENLNKFFPDEESLFCTFVGMNARYSSLIDNFPKDVDPYNKEFDDDNLDEQTMVYLKNVIEKLSAFKRNGYREINRGTMPGIYIHNQNDNSNHNEIKVSNNITTFQDARQKIENMSVLPDSEIDEILTKIDEIEKVVNSDNRKSKKWENVKGIIKWVADKGFEVAQIILPLILKID